MTEGATHFKAFIVQTVFKRSFPTSTSFYQEPTGQMEGLFTGVHHLRSIPLKVPNLSKRSSGALSDGIWNVKLVLI